jgi:ATP-dependent DNA ligase
VIIRSRISIPSRENTMPGEETKAHFFEPMLLLATNSLPEGKEWEYEVKLDGYVRYPAIASALQKLPDETVIDGEVVAFDDSGRPSFNTLQNFGSSTGPLFYYVFDLLILGGKDVRFKPLERRRELLKTKVLSKLHEPIRYSRSLNANLPDLIRSVHDMPKRRALASPATDSKIDYC